MPTADKGSIIAIQSYLIRHTLKIDAYNLNFTKNIGTPLSLNYIIHNIKLPFRTSSININISGNISFIENYAVTGGGMYISGNSRLTIAPNANITFQDNYASYGGAIFVDQDYCFVDGDENSIIFSNNSAISGQCIFSSFNWCSFSDGSCALIHNNCSIMSPPTTLSFNANNTASVFPGQTITGDMTVIDCLNSTTSCLAEVKQQCAREQSICDEYYIYGPSSVALFDGRVTTGLKINSITDQKNYMQVSLVCKSPIRLLPKNLTINITIILCPLGFMFNASSKQCECDNKVSRSNFICNRDIGYVCIRQGYWYGSSHHTMAIGKCINLFCDYSKPTCPSDTANYILLGNFQDYQCIGGHGGILCTGCTHNKSSTYGILQCIDSDKCAKWHPYVLLLLNIVTPFIYGVLLIIVVKLKLSIGSGYLYGPLFYLAVLNLLPFTSYGTFDTIVSSFVATLLLQFRVLGYIPWCFFDTVSLLTSKWFELIAPSVVAVVLLLTVYVARCSPKIFGRIQQSPLQAMCLLMFVLFWSLASTAISVITPVFLQVSQVYKARVHLQPDLTYLSGGHIPLWIISVMILLIFSRFLNLHRLKPVLDEFQSCYRDNYRWYGGVYFILWTIFQVLIISSSYQSFQTTAITLTATHCLLQPYNEKWLNLVDGFLLACFSVTSCLILSELSPLSLDKNATKWLVYVSVMVPLCFISLGIVSIVLVRFGGSAIWKNIVKIFSGIRKAYNQRKTKPAVTRSIININRCQSATDDSHYREPLIRYLQDTTCSTSTDNYDTDSD